MRETIVSGAVEPALNLRRGWVGWDRGRLGLRGLRVRERKVWQIFGVRVHRCTPRPPFRVQERSTLRRTYREVFACEYVIRARTV
jgi:hypothetical protein